MKKIDIVYNQSLKAVEGINYVNNSFVMGQKYFNDKGYELNCIYSPYECFNCSGAQRLDTIGSNINTKIYSRKRRIRVYLKKVFSSEYLLGALIKYYFNHYRPSKKAAQSYMNAATDSEAVIFQDCGSAYFYLKNAKNKKKTILILHCSKDPLEQFYPQFPALGKSKIFRKRMDSMFDFVFDHIDHVVYLSNRAVQYSVADNRKKSYVFNGEEDIDNWTVTEVHKPLNFVCVGSMSWRKGQDFIIEAFAKLPKETLNKVKLHLIGDGPQKQELKDRVLLLGLSDSVVFYGARNDVPELLKLMDLFIMPSESEGLPMSIIEALRQGMYVMATDTGAIPEMIPEGCGELIERDSDRIAECIVRIVNENRISIDTKIKARNHYLENFTLKSMIYNYCSILDTL